jgi:WD40 repeat protein
MPARLDDHDYGQNSPAVLCVRFSPDGQTLATASHRDSTVRLRDPASGQVRMSLLGPAHTVTSVEFAPDGATLVAGDSRGSLTFWEIKSGHPRSTWKVQDNWIRTVAFSGDGRTVASAGGEVVKMWEIAAHEQR